MCFYNELGVVGICMWFWSHIIIEQDEKLAATMELLTFPIFKLSVNISSFTLLFSSCQYIPAPLK